MIKRVYLAGPEVFLANAREIGARKRAICEQHGRTCGRRMAGWLRAKETGRYELEVDGRTVSPNNFTSSTCICLLAHPRCRTAARPLKLWLWATCTTSLAVRNQRISVALLEKAPSDLNLRAITGDDLAHKQVGSRPQGSSG
jgi:hypothetical protein